MANVTWLADVLRAAGCQVREVPGWKSRGRPLSAVNGVVWHHTATGPGWSNERVQDLLVDGRADLAGPLAQLGLERDGTFVVIAAGRCNHNGYGEWGNSSIGIEAYNSGTGEAWPQAQVYAYVQGTAAILSHLGLPSSACKGHKETDPKRKIDPAGLDMDEMRRNIQSTMTTTKPENDMTPEQEKKLDRALAILDRLDADYLTKGKAVRQVIVETKAGVERIEKQV